MRALLLAAGLGTRLRPLTDTVPKCLVPIAGRPLLDYWLELLRGQDIRALINTHYLPDRVEEYLRGSRYQAFARTVHEPELLGTGGTLLANRAYFEEGGSGPVLLVHADNFSRFDLGEMIRAHSQRPPHCEMTMMTFVTPTPEQCGILELDARGVVQRMHEKVNRPCGNLANGAVYILEPTIFGQLAALGKNTIDFSTEILPSQMGKIFAWHNGQLHIDIGTPENYRRAQKLALG